MKCNENYSFQQNHKHLYYVLWLPFHRTIKKNVEMPQNKENIYATLPTTEISFIVINVINLKILNLVKYRFLSMVWCMLYTTLIFVCFLSQIEIRFSFRIHFELCFVQYRNLWTKIIEHYFHRNNIYALNARIRRLKKTIYDSRPVAVHQSIF